MPTAGHMVVPWEENVHVTPFHTIKRAQVYLSPDDAHRMSGWGDNAKMMLSKMQLEAIAEAAGIEIVESKPLPTEHPAKILWQIKAVVEGADGKKKTIIKTYPLDMRLESRDGADGGYIMLARQRARDSADYILSKPDKRLKAWHPQKDDKKGWEEWIENKAMKDWTMTFRHAESRAETGASLRAIRSKCRIRNLYTPQEFQQPWVVYRAEFDLGRALAAGGAMGEMAMKGLSAMMTQSLGLPEAMTANMIEAASSASAGNGGDVEIEEPDLLNADGEEIEELEVKMKEAGFKTRAACDGRAMDIFGVPLSQLTKRHVSLMLEYIQIGTDAVSAELTKEEMAELTQHLFGVMGIAYADGLSVEDLIEEKWWNMVYAIEPEDEEGEEGEGAEGEGAEKESGEEKEEEEKEDEEGEETEETEEAEEDVVEDDKGGEEKDKAEDEEKK